MAPEFNKLSTEEYEDLKNAISWITILIAGADGNIETAEISWAEKLTQIRSYKIPSLLLEYYQDVGTDFHERLHSMIDAFPDDVDSRTEELSKRIAGLNPILAKLNQSVGAELYESYLSFAKHVARASGGFLRFFSVSKEEKSLMDLDMLTKIELPEEGV